MKRSVWAFSACVAVMLTSCASSPQIPRTTSTLPAKTATTGKTHIDWPTFDFDAARSGVNLSEGVLTTGNIANAHELWSASLAGVEDSAPILLHDLTFPDGSVHDVLYATTRSGSLVALDAKTGSTLWSHRPAGPHITHSSPVADPSRQYVYAYGLDGYVHKYVATSGAEIRTGGWPVRITHMTGTEKESSALNLADGYLYVTTSGYLGDAPPYQGHVVAVNLKTGVATVFNALCSDIHHLLTSSECTSEMAGIWARAGTVVDPLTGDVFAVTGNGPFTANENGTDWEDTVLKLSSDVTQVDDSYTPNDYQHLDDYDVDLGSTAPALLPSVPQSSTPLMLVQSGKDGILRLLNRSRMSGTGTPGGTGGELQTIPLIGHCQVFTQPVAWKNPATGYVMVFVASTCALQAFQVQTSATGTTSLQPVWSDQFTATSPIVAGTVLYAATDHGLLGLNPLTGAQLWTARISSSGETLADFHWQSPIVVNGTIYCADESGHVYAFGL